jgi:hypothetical protein
MSVNVSVRLDDALAERLRLRARAAGETLSDRLRRYAEEGARREEHPLVVFRDGPSGRRAGLLGGPDVWEVAMWSEDLTDEADPVATLVRESSLTRSQVDAALRYRTAYPDEIAARIVLIALSSRFSRRPAGIGPLMAAIRAIAGEQLDDRLVYLRRRPG